MITLTQEVFLETTEITILVFLMMIVIDFIDVRSQGRLRQLVKGGLWRQYTSTSILGATPGCLGAFMTVTLYIHGFVSFGAVVACMIATSGDEAFVMLAQFPKQALLLIAILFVLAIPLGRLSDLIAKKISFIPCKDCTMHKIHKEEKEPGHYIKEHVWNHIIKSHIWRVFLWTFSMLLIMQVGLQYWSLENIVKGHLGFVLILSVLVGIIPESGPHLLFVMMFANGLVPFSILLASSIAQDGHGMLPLLSYTIRDSLLIKVFNLGAALLVGGAAYSLGW